MTIMEPTYTQPNFRIRSDDSQTLNADAGWAQNINVDATIDAGQRFRVRFELEETAGNGGNNTFKLQYDLNSAGSWADVICTGNATDTDSPIICVLSNQYSNGDATTDVLSGSAATFVAGEGVANAGDPQLPVTGTINIDSEHTEVEVALVINTIWGENSQLSDGDTIDLRWVEGDGTAFSGSYNNPQITVNITAGHIGGTYVETPKVLIHEDSNGNLYWLSEATAGLNAPVMLKSADNGSTWSIQDGANRPTQNDLESFDVFQDGDTLHMAHYAGNAVYYHTFRTSDHASADTWGTTDTTVFSASGGTPQQCKVVVRSDGDVIVFYNRTATDISLYYKIDTGAGFGSEQTLDAESGVNMTGLTVVMGASDKAHIFYRAGTVIYHRSLDSSDTLSGRESCETIGSVTNAEDPFAGSVYWDDGGTEKVMAVYVDDGGDELLHSCVVANDGTPGTPKTVSGAAVLPNGLDAQQTVASVSVYGDTAYVLYARSSDKDFYSTSSKNDGTWSTDVKQKDAIDGSWMRTIAYTHGSTLWLGYIWDTGAEYTSNSNDATGYIRYDEFVLARLVNPSSAVTIGESVTVSVESPDGSLSVSVSTAIAIGETTTADVSDPQVVVSTGVTVSEIITAILCHLVEVNSAVSIGESALAALVHQISANSAVSIAETITPLLVSLIDVSSGVTVAGAPALEITPEISASTGITIGETTNVAIVLAPDLSVSVSSAITIGNVPTAEFIAEINTSTAITIGQSVTVVAPEAGTEVITVEDGITIGETVTVALSDNEIAVASAITIGETVEPLLVHLVGVSSAVSLAETITAALSDSEIAVSETITIGDSPTVSLGAGVALTISVASAVTIADAPTAEFAPEVVVSSGITIVDAPTIDPLLLIIALSEAITIADDPTVERDLILDNVTDYRALFIMYRDKRLQSQFRDKRAVAD